MKGVPVQFSLDGEGPPSFPPAATAEQLSLLGEPTHVRVPALLWRSWLADERTVARFEAKQHHRSSILCWYWLGAISSTSHGSFRAASLPGPSRRGTVPTHIFAFHLANGMVPRPGWSAADDPVVCHHCDDHTCTNPAHLRLGTSAQNRAEWKQRHRNPSGPPAAGVGDQPRRATASSTRRQTSARADGARAQTWICTAASQSEVD
jgi:hypothetical protein